MRITKKKPFEVVPGPFGVGPDERATQDAFVEYVGGHHRAERLSYIWQNSYPSGTEYDRLMGRGASKEEVFRRKAVREGFDIEDANAFLKL